MTWMVIDESAVDEIQHKAVMDWVIDELLVDIENNRKDIVCLVYGMAFRSVSTSGKVRVMLQSKTGGYDPVKPFLMLQLVQGLTESARKTGGSGFLKSMPWWRRMAFHILMMLPKL